jgi:hypothetical protein
MAATRFDDVPIEAHFHVGRELIKQKKTKKNGRRSLEIYVRGAPGGPFVAQAERLLRGR